MKHIRVPRSFVYPSEALLMPAYKFGSNQVVGKILKNDRDWRNCRPPGEEQNVRGIESSACYIEAQQHVIATLQEAQYNLLDKNYDSRFNVILSNGTENGGDPIAGAQSIRHDGLVEGLLPFSEEILSWQDFASFKGADKDFCIKKGQDWLKEWTPKYDIVFTRSDSLQEKYRKLKEALQYSPVAMSVNAWYEQNGLYVKPKGSRDTHLVQCDFLDENNCPYFWDTYSPFSKKGEPFYNSDFAMRWSLSRTLSTTKKKWFYKIYDIIKSCRG